MKYLIQHALGDQISLLGLSGLKNDLYVKYRDYCHITDISARTDRSPYWEKVAFIRQVLDLVEEEALVVWLDADCLIVGDEDFADALPTGILGMVPCVNRQWFNSGVMVMRNCAAIREFWGRVWGRSGTHYIEPAVMAELRMGEVVCERLDYRWNRWLDNRGVDASTVVRAWHAMPTVVKLSEMRSAVNSESTLRCSVSK